MRSRKATRGGLDRFRAHVTWPAFAVFGLLFVATVVSQTASGDIRAAAATAGILAGNLLAAFVFIRKAQQVDPGERRAWMLVGIGFGVAAMGLVVLATQVVLTGDASLFSPIDLFFLAGYVLIIVGFASLPHAAGQPLQRARTGMDGLIGSLSIAALFWVLVLSRVVAGLANAPLGSRIIGSLYPLADLAMIVIIMIVILRRSSYRFDPRLVLFTTAVALQTIGDVSFLVSAVENDSLAEAEPLYPFYLLASAAFLGTALIVDIQPEPREYAERTTPLWSVLAPYTAAAAMLVVTVSRLTDAVLDTGDRVLLLATLVVAVLVIVRQTFSIRENRILIEQHRTDLVSSISHELRTPLTAMLGFLSILDYNEVSGPRERAELIGVVHHQATYLERIVEDLLLLADEDPSRMSLTMGTANVRATIEHALYSTAINHDHVAIEAPPAMIAHVDPERFEQILVNLVTNADRYGGDRCLIRVFARGGTLVLEVHDTGAGVPKKHELVIWDRFERGPNRYNASVPGTGIGLAVVRTIAEAHGGRVGYRRSEDLGGGCFWVELPGRLDSDKERAPLDLLPAAPAAAGGARSVERSTAAEQ